MTTITSTSTSVTLPEPDYFPDETEVAAAAFLARYSGRTLDAYRHDLRQQHRGPGSRAGPSNPANSWEGQQAGDHPARASHSPDDCLAVGERCEGPILCRCDGQLLDRRFLPLWCRSFVVARSLLALRRSEATRINGNERFTGGARWEGPEHSTHRSSSPPGARSGKTIRRSASGPYVGLVTMTTLHTVGHGTLPIEGFTSLIESTQVGRVVDIRSFPGSRHNPQFRREEMERWAPIASRRR